jgi:hypothetical protein
MLSKKICRKCLNVNLGEGCWSDATESVWNEQRQIVCPTDRLPWSYVDKAPPKHCLYKFEQAIYMGVSK